MTEREKVEIASRTVDSKVGELLAIVSSRAVRRTNRYWLIGSVVLLVLILGGLFSIQVQLVQEDREKAHLLVTRCEERNRQAASVEAFAATMVAVESKNELIDPVIRQQRIEAYSALVEAYGSRLNCAVYLK